MGAPDKLAILFHLMLIINCHGNDLLALLSFKSSISQDPHQALASWNNNTTDYYCNWQGVMCSLRHSSRVIELNLDAFDISGTLSPSISNLTFLQRLSLSNNRLHGHIPLELGNLRHLQFLNMSVNSLIGEIPSTLSQCSQLEIISLSNNKLQGEVPSSLSKCINLKIISLWNNFLTGSIPSDFSSMQHLTSLDVNSNNLTGSIPSSIGNISNLRNLDVSNNMITGAIPPSLTRLSSLMYICLNKNSLTGNIPSFIGNLSSLVYIGMSYNNLTGELPSSLKNLTSLTNFDVRSNSFSGGIPSWIGTFSMLKGLGLYGNYFSGSIPTSLGSSSTLIELDLAQNQLSGSIPPSLFNFSSIESLSFSENEFSGTLPQDLGNNLPCLRDLIMYINRLHGPIPMSLANATKLEIIALSTNNLTGNIPANLGTLQALYWLNLESNELKVINDEGWNFLTFLQNYSQLQFLELEGNRLRGALPRSIANLSTGLSRLTLGANQLSGILPVEIGNLDSLTVLSLDENQFEGNIPATIGKLRNLHILDLTNNKFSGPIPVSFGNFTKLLELGMKGNNFEGSIPKSLGECKALEVLDLSRNRLTGAIPKEILSLESLSRGLDLSYNLFSGFLPLEVGILKNLRELRVEVNNLSGEIPITIGGCTVLEILHMESNQFQGNLPQSMSNLKGLKELDVSHNSLSGLIPDFLDDFILLHYLNLSFNNFEGEIPQKGVFSTVGDVSLTGNDRLCGGDPRLNFSPCPLKNQMRTHDPHRLKVILAVSISAIFLFLLVCLLAIQKWLHNRRKKTPSLDSMKDLLAKVSFSELLKGTDEFSSKNLIGIGKFGIVYKGTISLDEQQVVAIKVLNYENHFALKSFEAECSVLKNVRHRNLIKIISSCSSVDYKGNDFKALVFEYMPNGSLEEWLHPEGQDKHQKQSLNLNQRINIAIDVASALEYLHHHGPTPIVHCDLKPSNVLLDDDMTAHVGDFGLARFITISTSRPSQNASMSIGIKGTIGYVAPEYGMTNQVSIAGDVYSYGIFLLEMLTNKRPTDASFKNSVNLHIFVQNALPEHVIDIIDPFLIFEGGGESVDEREKRHKCLIQTLKIGLFCSMDSPRERMKIGDAIKELHSIRKKFLTPET